MVPSQNLVRNIGRRFHYPLKKTVIKAISDVIKSEIELQKAFTALRQSAFDDALIYLDNAYHFSASHTLKVLDYSFKHLKNYQLNETSAEVLNHYKISKDLSEQLPSKLTVRPHL